MKNLRILLMVALSSATISAFAQQGKFGVGQDSVECVQNLQFYKDYYDQKDFKSAYPYWAKALKICPPKASQNLYTCGLSIMKYFVENTKDSVERRHKVDSVMMLYERRMDNFPVNKLSSYENMAFDLMAYMTHNEDEIHKALQRAVNAGRERTDVNIMFHTMRYATLLYDKGAMPAEKVIETYAVLNDYLTAAIAKNPSDDKLPKVRQDVESVFLTCDAASCATLEPLLQARFEQSPGDIDVVASIVKLLNAKECTNSQLYTNAAEAYYQLDPSPISARALAKMFLAKNEVDKSIEYFKNAIEGATDNNDKSIWQMELGTVYFQQKNNVSQAANYAKQAVSSDPQNAKAYMLLGSIWAGLGGRCGDNEIEKAAPFWVAVDFFTKAKQVDPNLAADVNKYITSYSNVFPRQGDAVMYDLVDGTSYTVTCNGLSERTIVRTRK